LKSRDLIIIALVIVGSISAVSYVLLTSKPAETNKIRLGSLFSTDETDLGWCTAQYAAIKAAKAKYDNFEADMSYYVPYAEAARIARDYAARGYDLVWGGGGEHQDAIQAAAKEFPNVKFIQYNAFGPQPRNVIGIFPRMAEGSYIAGVLAGHLTKTKKIGYIYGEDYPWGRLNYASLAAGAKSVDPSIEVIWGSVGSWKDPSTGYSVAVSMIDEKKVDIIMQEADLSGRGIITACIERNVLIIGTYQDQWTLAPKNMITSVALDEVKILDDALQRILKNTWDKDGGKILEPGLADGAVWIAPYHEFENKISESVKNAVQNVKSGILAGTIKVPTLADLGL
jgi:basic membrane protein A